MTTVLEAPQSTGSPTRRDVSDPLSQEILELKRRHNAVILAHNYQIPEIQDVADYVGDSLGLSQQAARTPAEVIVFCGVHFMAETIAYINCSAAVKAISDVICTSGNARKIVENAPKDRDLLFVPDENLGAWVMEQTGRPMTLWKGNCYVHVEWTEKMVAYCRQNPSKAFVIATEAGMLHRLRRECPDKVFIPAPTERCACNECRFMKMNTLEKLRDCLRDRTPEVLLPADVIAKARLPIERMLEISARP